MQATPKILFFSLSLLTYLLGHPRLYGQAADVNLEIHNAVEVSFDAEAEKLYLVESSPEVEPANWRFAGAVIEGTGERHRATFLTKDAGKKIFRVVEVDLNEGLTAYYPFDGSAMDVIGTNDGVVTGATLASDKFGNVNSAYEFRGTNSWILCPDLGFPSGNSPRAISLWIYFRSYGVPTPTVTPLITYGSGGANDTFYAVLFGAVRPNNPIAVGRSGGGDAPQAEGTELNRWYHLAFSHDGSQTKIYVDGALRGTANRTYNTMLDGNFYIGSYTHTFGWDETGPCVDGYVDNVRVYSRAISESEIRALWQLGK